MSLNVALQSVAFYILSCSTCSKVNHRRKAKAEARRERVKKEALEAQYPELYRHPSPFSTNQYWSEEILMGPGLPKKKDRRSTKSANCRVFDTPGYDNSYAGSAITNSEVHSSLTTVTEGSLKSNHGWNIKRYQREDEILWGTDISKPTQIIMDAVVKAGCAAGKLIEGGLSMVGGMKEDSRDRNPPSYYLRNPPLNELHPPVVSTAPVSIAETRWMIQPPPSAKVMEGKERVDRSRASSNSSSRRYFDNNPLSGQIVERLVDAKLKRESPIQSEQYIMKTRTL
ncbi:hypothetical protein HI914_05723 [Erysiphe necator]|uniref:Signal peptide-containing protein n=1 Tax=Uncinula necator TaxID=52586 RepID=A0A0B1PC06_UNCNE|nr:hypothetical protein HI914_05723 [Erysiphe necator]KHJ34194.1 hypothetical protein EV44_g0529 [Erysiphe necator]